MSIQTTTNSSETSWETEAKLAARLVRPEYINLAGLVSGVLLSQIVYWFRPKPGGKSRLSIQREDRFWIAKTTAEWCEECVIGEYQFPAAVKKLVELGVIEHRIFHRAGKSVAHISLNLEHLLSLTGHPPDGVLGIPDSGAAGWQVGKNPIPLLGKTQDPSWGKPNSQVGENPIPYIEETTEEESTKDISLAQALEQELPKSKEQAGPLQESQVATLKEQLELKAKTEHGLEACWKAKLSAVYGGFVPSLLVKERAQLKSLRLFWKATGFDPPTMLDWVVDNWQTVAGYVRVTAGLAQTPSRPVIGWMLVHKGLTLDCYAEQHKVEVQVVQLIAPPKKTVVDEDDKPAVFTPEQIAAELEKFSR